MHRVKTRRWSIPLNWPQPWLAIFSLHVYYSGVVRAERSSDRENIFLELVPWGQRTPSPKVDDARYCGMIPVLMVNSWSDYPTDGFFFLSFLALLGTFASGHEDCKGSNAIFEYKKNPGSGDNLFILGNTISAHPFRSRSLDISTRMSEREKPVTRDALFKSQPSRCPRSNGNRTIPLFSLSPSSTMSTTSNPTESPAHIQPLHNPSQAAIPLGNNNGQMGLGTKALLAKRMAKEQYVSPSSVR